MIYLSRNNSPVATLVTSWQWRLGKLISNQSKSWFIGREFIRQFHVFGVDYNVLYELKLCIVLVFVAFSASQVVLLRYLLDQYLSSSPGVEFLRNCWTLLRSRLLIYQTSSIAFSTCSTYMSGVTFSTASSRVFMTSVT